MFGFRNSKRNRYKNGISNSALVTKVLEIFPDACPFYVRNLCIGRSDNPFDMDHVMRPLIRGNYPKNKTYKLDDGSFEENLNTLESIFPDADPNYLHYHAVLCSNDKNKLESFIASTLEKLDYPVIRKNESARKNGQYYICNCCYDEEVKPRDLGTCESGCVFCKSCIQRSVEIAYGEGKIIFPCLSGCSANFNLQTLEDVLPRKFYDKISQKTQMEEVKAARIENLEMCPFCDFAMIPFQEDKIFRCQNAECRKESCRLCKQLAHLPLRCEEVTKPEEIQKRTYMENKLSEALIRSCYKCGLKFIKSEGCNRMKCSCGAMMCYLCLAPVQDYKHFNGPGGDNYHLCPLFSDTDELHEQNIKKGAANAKLDILLNRHVQNNKSTSKPQSGKLLPTKPVPKPQKKGDKQSVPNIPSVPPKTYKKKKAPPRPPPPVMQYISAIYTINNPSSSTQPTNDMGQAIPLRKAPPPPSSSKDNSEASPTMTSHHVTENHSDRMPTAAQISRRIAFPRHLENQADQIPAQSERQPLHHLNLEKNSVITGVEPQRTDPPAFFNTEPDTNIISEIPRNTVQLHHSSTEHLSDVRPVPAPRRRIPLGNTEHKPDNVLAVPQENNNIDLINFDSDSEEAIITSQDTINSNSFPLERNIGELPSDGERTVTNVEENIDDIAETPHCKVDTTNVENQSKKIPVPAPRYSCLSSNKENSTEIISTEPHQINNLHPSNLHHDSDETKTPQHRIYPNLFNLDNSSDETVTASQPRIYIESLPHSNSLDSFNSADSSNLSVNHDVNLILAPIVQKTII